ncbi:putative secreted protein [Nostocoides japonicum T1-X7]|uniref:Putative secreted protein n=1 Tax=Nostocoides japonicum T1-X7 TaxID=1194083 RepID=A0A077LZG3_9MICO|nr:PDZ domain-containing protein [Tetrasphaera japonica]CCH77375.1 putative secreted protein [Tetrasphaera japonica T1-X7]
MSDGDGQLSPPNVPGGPADEEAPDPRRTSRLSKIVFVVAVLVIVVPAIAAFIPVPYVILGPGPVTNVLGTSDGKPIVQVSGHDTYPTTGTLDFTTISMRGGPESQPSALEVVGALVRRGEEIHKQSEYFPEGTTNQQIQDENAAAMTDSQQEAIAIALTELGEPVTQKVTIGAFATNSAAEKAGLKKGDQIVAIDGHRIVTVDDVRPAVTAKKPGQIERIEVRRGGKAMTFDVVTTDNDGTAALGVYLSLSFTFPFSVRINAGDVGGPSAGMMFSLGVYDVLTPGALTGGQRIAGTGTIDYEGHVGAIGGIQQKMIGARRDGASWFIAPTSNCNEVVGHVPSGLHVVKVATFTEARTAVVDIAKHDTSGLPTCTAATSSA